MFKKNAIILGGSLLNKGVYEKLHLLELNVIVIDYRTNIIFDYDEHIVFDATDPKIASVLRDQGYTDISLVYTSMDNAGLAQQAICQKYNLLYAPKEAILSAHHKNIMHQKWKNAGLLNRQSIALQEFNMDIISELNKNKKIIIKPANACASRGITVIEKNATKEILELAFDNAKKQSTNTYVNIEEYIYGMEFTVDMLGDNYGNVSVFGISQRYHSTKSSNIIVSKVHFNSSSMTKKLQEKIAAFGIKCYHGLGLKNTLGHLEIIMQEDGALSPVEMGARSSGYIASHFTDFSTGKSFLNEFMQVLAGKKIDNGLLPQTNISSMYFYYDLLVGIKSKKETNLTNFLDKSITSHGYNRSNLIGQQVFQSIQQETDIYGFEVLKGEKEILTLEHVLQAEQAFLKDFFYE